MAKFDDRFARQNRCRHPKVQLRPRTSRCSRTITTFADGANPPNSPVIRPWRATKGIPRLAQGKLLLAPDLPSNCSSSNVDVETTHASQRQCIGLGYLGRRARVFSMTLTWRRSAIIQQMVALGNNQTLTAIVSWNDLWSSGLSAESSRTTPSMRVLVSARESLITRASTAQVRPTYSTQLPTRKSVSPVVLDRLITHDSVPESVFHQPSIFILESGLFKKVYRRGRTKRKMEEITAVWRETLVSGPHGSGIQRLSALRLLKRNIDLYLTFDLKEVRIFTSPTPCSRNEC
jgi:hypothetical protein